MSATFKLREAFLSVAGQGSKVKMSISGKRQVEALAWKMPTDSLTYKALQEHRLAAEEQEF